MLISHDNNIFKFSSQGWRPVWLLLAMLFISIQSSAAPASSPVLSHETSIDYTMYRLATEQNDPSAQYLVGRNYLKGKSVEQNVKEAIKWFEMAAKQNHIRAQYQLGKIYLYGEGIKQNLNLAYYFLGKAADKNHLDSQFELGNYFLKGDPNNRQYAKAIEWFRRAAARDHVRAYYELGKLTYEGKGITANTDEGTRLLNLAAENGYLPATTYLNNIENGISNDAVAKLDTNQDSTLDNATSSDKANLAGMGNNIAALPSPAANEDYKLGLAYLTGDGKDKDVQKAADHFTKAAKDNHGKAQYQLAKLYQQGIGVKQSDAQHLKWLEKAASAGVHSAIRDLNAIQSNDKSTIAKQKSTNPTDFYSLGIQYYYGQSVKKDETEAAKWFMKAANKNHTRAQYQLGLMFRDGIGVSRNLKTARQWFQIAANSGLTEAQVALLDLKPDRKVTEIAPIIIKHNSDDPLSSQLISQKSSPIASFLSNAKNGDRVAQYQVGVKYLNGEDGVDRDVDQAIKWLQTAANNNHKEASITLGMLYYKGDDVERDYQAAAKWLEKAARQGDSDAQLLLGDFFRNGLGVRKNSTTAVKWYRKAANQGHKEARKRLGGCRIC